MAVIRRGGGPVSNPLGEKSATAVFKEAKDLGLHLMPFDIESLLQHYKISVCYEDMDDLSGYVERRGKGWFIGVNIYQSKRRQRFTMAHELGHICLHANSVASRRAEKIYFRSQLTTREEKEANEFASDLLIPRHLLFAQIAEGRKKLSDLADIFEVSLDAMRYKAFKLKLIPEY